VWVTAEFLIGEADGSESTWFRVTGGLLASERMLVCCDAAYCLHPDVDKDDDRTTG